MKKVIHPIHVLLTVFFTSIVLYLTLLAGFSTSLMTNAKEHTFLVSDSIAINIIIAAAFLSVFSIVFHLMQLWQQKEALSGGDQHSRINRLCSAVLCLIAALALLFVIVTQRNARADQRQVQLVVSQWIDRDYSCFEMDDYLDRYPNQAGIVLICYLFSFIVGTKNYLAFQFANVIALIAIYKTLGDIAEKKTGRIEYRLAIYFFGLLFLPGIMYVGFVYGNLIGLALSLISFKHALLFLENQKFRNGFIAVLAIFGAAIIKQNYFIFGIALIIFLLIELIRKFKIRLLAVIAVTVLVLAFSGAMMNEAVYLITGIRMGKGLSKWSWVTMGLMENESLYDGWWNRYNQNSYAESYYDTDLQTEKNKEDLMERLQIFQKNPQYAIRFFAGKNASQWNNPSFQAMWINRNMAKNEEMRSPEWINRLIYEDGTGPLTQFFNYYQFILLTGVLLHILTGGLRKNEHDFFFVITFIGGFVFHTIWEAKGQCTISYFWLLIPLSAEGYLETAERICLKIKTKEPLFRKPSAKTLAAAGIAVVLTAAVLLADSTLFRNVFLRDEDTASFTESVLNNRVYKIQEGDYFIHPKQDPSLTLSSASTDESSAALKFVQNDMQEMGVTHIRSNQFNEYQVIEFITNHVLDVKGGKDKAGTAVHAYVSNNTTAQHWNFRYKNENEYAIFHSGLALTYSIEDNKFSLENYNGSDQQKWIIEIYKSEN